MRANAAIVRNRNYLAEIAATDAAIGVLLEALRERGELERALVVVAGDHGEDLGQHGEPTHSAFVYDSTVRVPLLIRHPDGWGAGRRSPAIVSVTDVFPTIAEALALDPALAPEDLDGMSLFRREPPADGVVTRPERGDRSDRGRVLVTMWGVVQKIAGGTHAKPREPLRATRADSLEVLNRPLQVRRPSRHVS